MYGKIPWLAEAEIWKTLPKTSRIPTGGWRGYGAVPSHSYPQPSVLPGGYWRGMGLVPSVYDSECQAAKTLRGFGATTATATATPATATPTPKVEPNPWVTALESIVKAGTQAYTIYETTQAQEAAIKAGVPIASVFPGAQVAPPPTAEVPAQKSNTLLYVGVAAGLGLLAIMALKR